MDNVYSPWLDRIRGWARQRDLCWFLVGHLMDDDNGDGNT